MKVGIVGASGYVGGEVLRLLVSHTQFEIAMVTSRQYVGEYLHRIQPSLKGFTDLTFSELDYEKMSDKCDLVFTAVPHGTATEIVKTLYDRGMKIIYPNQYLEFQKSIGNKSKMHNSFRVLDVWQ